MKKEYKHIVWDLRLNQCRCNHCGETYAPTLPCPLLMITEILKAFTRQHRGCKKPAPPASEKEER